MLTYEELIKELKYEDSPHYLEDVQQFDLQTVHLFRVAREIGVKGIYTFQTSKNTDDYLQKKNLRFMWQKQKM